MNPTVLVKQFPLAVSFLIAPISIGLIVISFLMISRPGDPLIVKPDPFGALQLEARAAVVYDPITQQVIYAKNENQTLPIASLTKLMTSYLAEKKLPAETIITDANNRSWRLQDLLAVTLVSSSNDGAERLAAAVASATGGNREAFVTEMNLEASRRGFNQTYFLNPTGLDLADRPGAESTALEMAKFLTAILVERPNLLAVTTKATVTVSYLGNNFIATNTNTGIAKFPGLLASKTGFTKEAGGSLAVAFEAGLNQPLVIVVLNSTETGRIADVRRLADAAINWFALKGNDTLE